MKIAALALALALTLGLILGIGAAEAQPATAPGDVKTVTIGAGSWMGYALIGFNPYGDRKSFYSQKLATKGTRLTVHSRGSEARQGAEEATQLIRLDLSALPKDAKITQARLVFPVVANAKAGKQNTLLVYQVLAPWDDKVDWKTRDGQAAWEEEGALGEKDRKKVAELVVPEQKYDYKTPYEASVDVTELVKAWASGAAENHGIKLELLGGYMSYLPEGLRLEVGVP